MRFKILPLQIQLPFPEIWSALVKMDMADSIPNNALRVKNIQI